MSGAIWVGNTQRHTFALLWCERCGHASEPPARPELPPFVDDDQPLKCNDCGEMLTLLRCMVDGAHYQERLGMPHRFVATLGELPDRNGHWR
jgi:hypothetical protein